MATTTDQAGSVVSLWRYPVKSMMGEEVNLSELTKRGLFGDRAWALIDASDGKVASAKNPRKWANLFEFSAHYTEAPEHGGKLPPVRIMLPDGTQVTSERGDVDEALSEAVGREVRLERREPGQEEILETTFPNPWTPKLEEYWPDIEGLAHRDHVTDEAMPEGTFFDLAMVHVLTTATLDRLRELYPEGRFEVRRFRPNIVVQPSDGRSRFVENEWIGKTLAIGDEVRLEVTGPCPRCVMTTLPQGDLPKDRGILRTAAKHNEVHVGVYASVLQGGKIRKGDRVRVE
ncbi:MAG: MOSC domain-containing protein [Acidobacteria bacterium]|nr:MOSC domain-containing protein [Acidobacteriota bacterium]